ncbi:hypothetical protein TRFO_05015 [Tritrichomonas foetus]|uniref:Uncharacterized protein n=1 Tax=Tritrichomonas foetus TaxID=1144522 RepID=A0A1J4KE52_9EUKA|nr:hypothetical protein TRFO_05015 [Tritrichomonas foetus]|eukprot:OHT07910.1 hypothetical protein TRFO_05015 [Tritrichomonas foetus]
MIIPANKLVQMNEKLLLVLFILMVTFSLGFLISGFQFYSFIDPWWYYTFSGKASSISKNILISLIFCLIALAFVILFVVIYFIQKMSQFFLTTAVVLSATPFLLYLVFGWIAVPGISSQSKCNIIKTYINQDIKDGNGYWSREKISLFDVFLNNTQNFFEKPCKSFFKPLLAFLILNSIVFLVLYGFSVPLTYHLITKSWDVEISDEEECLLS